MKRLNLADFQVTDREQCGIMVGNLHNEFRIVDRIIPVENRAVGEDDYAITMKDYREVERSLAPGEVIVGFFHTHLPHHELGPSENDFLGASLFPEYLNLVYKPDTGEMVWYNSSRVTVYGEPQ